MRIYSVPQKFNIFNTINIFNTFDPFIPTPGLRRQKSQIGWRALPVCPLAKHDCRHGGAFAVRVAAFVVGWTCRPEMFYRNVIEGRCADR